MINRISLVDPKQLGRSVVNRLTEPLEFLALKGLGSYEVLNPIEITHELLISKNFDEVFINKSCDKSTLELAKIIRSLKI